MFYIAYGSNLNIKEMKKRCPHSKMLGNSILKGYRLEFRHYLNIVEDPSSWVPVGVFDIAGEDMKALDEYEAYPELYKKEFVKVKFNNEIISALVYIMNDDKYLDDVEPTDEYVECCYRGYKDFDFDQHIINDAYSKLK